jgi:LysM repeat protein
MPELTISLPAALGLLAIFLIIGAGLVYLAMRQATPAVANPAGTETPTPTITETATATGSPTPATPTLTNTPAPTAEPQEYTIQAGDTCSGIANAFGVSIQSIVLLNQLPANCGVLSVGTRLKIPYPTPTATAPPTGTLSAAEATLAACEVYDYVVNETDTLSSIALNFAVPAEEISEWNGLVNNIVRFQQTLEIPLCKRASTPGPTPTATPPPPYAAPNLLLPADGAPFTLADETVTLQWAAVGALRTNESYAVTIVDVTEGENRKIAIYTTDTKAIVPASFRPNDNRPHVIRWTVLTVRTDETDDEGEPVWVPAGAASVPRDFTWTGVSSAVTPTP